VLWDWLIQSTGADTSATNSLLYFFVRGGTNMTDAMYEQRYNVCTVKLEVAQYGTACSRCSEQKERENFSKVRNLKEPGVRLPSSRESVPKRKT
jgi:hypothetical protein